MTENTPLRQKIGEFNLRTETVEEASNDITERLALRYCLLQPEKSPTDFIEEILKPLYNGKQDAPTTLELKIYADHSQQTYQLLMKQLITACVHCINAEVADEAGKHMEAWRHLSNAMYNVGMLEGTIIVEPAVAHIISSRSTSGARRRDEKYSPLRELARELASKKAHTSKRQAAFAVKDQVLAEAKRLGVELSEMQAERTITSWLAGMSFASKRKL